MVQYTCPIVLPLIKSLKDVDKELSSATREVVRKKKKKKVLQEMTQVNAPVSQN